jgi:LmbE family N-acetylglucosaminyl deacetylase
VGSSLHTIFSKIIKKQENPSSSAASGLKNFYMSMTIIKPKNISNQNILAFSAHPDDIEFGAGGTLLQLSKTNQVSLIIATDGQLGTHDIRADKSQLIKTRQQESRSASQQLGINKTIFWNYPDLRLGYWRPHLFKKTLKFLLKHRPDIIITQDPWARYEVALHPDHQLLSQVVLEAVLCGTLPLFLHRQGYTRKQPLSPKPQIWLTCPAEISHVVDISPVIRQKLDLLRSFSSQYDQELQWQKKADWITNLATHTASLVKRSKLEKAEGFRIINNNF